MCTVQALRSHAKSVPFHEGEDEAAVPDYVAVVHSPMNMLVIHGRIQNKIYRGDSYPPPLRYTKASYPSHHPPPLL